MDEQSTPSKSPVQSEQTPATPLAFNKEAVKRTKLEAELKENQADLDKLRKLCWSGIPRDLRPSIWRLLLGVMPANLERREMTLKRKREEYLQLLPEYEREPHLRSEYETTQLKQIQRDVPRPHLTQSILLTPVVQNALCRMLFLWTLRHPVVGFVQGMNDLASVFFSLYLYEKLGDDWEQAELIENVSETELLEIEADTFWSLSKLIDGMQDAYTNERKGLFRMLDTISLVISKVDPDLANHFKNEEIQYNTFAIPWLNCLLMRAFPLEMVWRLYDTYFSEGDISRFHPFVCAAFLTTFGSKLKQFDFQECMLFIQNPPTANWGNDEIELLLSQSFMYSSLFSSVHM
jgi:hypothetical protein